MFVKFANAKVIDVYDHRGRVAGKKLSSFDYEPRKDGKYLYAAVRACTADVPNLNYDMLPHSELKDCYRTFIGAYNYLNHDNQDPAKARGAVIDAKYHDEDPEDRWIECLIEMDEERCPKLCSLVRSGEIDTVSMGCNVESTTCSVCGNVAEYPFQYCEHVQQKGREFGGKLAYEVCNGIDFFELSWVYDPADPTAHTQCLASRKTAGRKAAGSEGVDWWRGCDGQPIYVGDAVIDDSGYWSFAGDDEWVFRGVEDDGRVLLEYDGEIYDDQYTESEISKCIHVASNLAKTAAPSGFSRFMNTFKSRFEKILGGIPWKKIEDAIVSTLKKKKLESQKGDYEVDEPTDLGNGVSMKNYTREVGGNKVMVHEITDGKETHCSFSIWGTDEDGNPVQIGSSKKDDYTSPNDCFDDVDKYASGKGDNLVRMDKKKDEEPEEGPEKESEGQEADDSEEELPEGTRRCKGTNADGEQCKNTIDVEKYPDEEYCEVHRKEGSYMGAMMQMVAECMEADRFDYVGTLPDEEQSEIEEMLRSLDMDDDDVQRGMDSRLVDLEDTIDTSRWARNAGSYATAPRIPDEVDIDSENAEACPLCGDPNFDGEFCNVCGYEEPPEGFGDIELEDMDSYDEYEEDAEEDDDFGFETPDEEVDEFEDSQKADELAESGQAADEEFGEDDEPMVDETVDEVSEEEVVEEEPEDEEPEDEPEDDEEDEDEEEVDEDELIFA